jgi:hypothetical protein
MILTPVEPEALPPLLARFAASLRDPKAREVFSRLARPEDALRAEGSAAERHHAAALSLAARQGMGLRPGRPDQDFSWDGSVLRTGTEAYVLLHEVAHFQLAPPRRRQIIDFGLGPGPETGHRAAAQAARCVAAAARETEEALASLLGILWEAEFGQPALASFLDQNWLEGAGRNGPARHFEAILDALAEGGFVDSDLRPTCRLRS